MPKLILEDDWSDYDDKKIKDNRDRKDFACTESWEVEYLVSKIKRIYPKYPETSIRNAISSVCRSDSAPHPRERFVKRVMEILRR
jgi:uridine kinase